MQGWNLVTLSLEKPDAREAGPIKIDLSNVDEVRVYPKTGDRLIIDLESGLIAW
jgi:hypothetical protein